VRLRGTIEAIVGSRFTDGNAVEVLRNGSQIFPSMLDAIDAAERTIDFVTFVYWTGDIADRTAEALARSSKSGVRVRVVLDAFGSSPMDRRLVRKMTAAGVAVERFRPVARWKFWETDHRTHRKILVVGDHIAFTG
jgi:cardiolipin synthase